MSEVRDVTGLVVIGFAGKRKIGTQWRSLVRCLCECGCEFIAVKSYVKQRKTKSCGCLRRRMAPLKPRRGSK